MLEVHETLARILEIDQELQGPPDVPFEEMPKVLPTDVHLVKQFPDHCLRLPLLPPETVACKRSFLSAVRSRASHREYRLDRPPEEAALSLLLHLTAGRRETIRAYGQSAFPLFHSPSSGGLRAADLYLILQKGLSKIEPGVYYYDGVAHALVRLAKCYPAPLVADVSMGQPFLQEAPALLVFVANLPRGLWKYGERYYKFALVDIGVVAAQAHLAAAALGLRSCLVAGFDPERLRRHLALPPGELPALMMSLGS